MQRSVSSMHSQTGAHLGRYNQHSCVAEAYKTRGRGFQGRKLRHLVTSKAGCNQASGSFLSAVCCSRYAAGCMVGVLSRLLAELMTKTLFWLFLHRLLADQKTVRHVHWQQEKRVFIHKASLTGFMSGKIKKKRCSRFCQREIYFSPWPVSHNGNRNKGAVKTVIKLNWKHRDDFKKRYIVHLVCSAGVLVWVCTCI